MQTISDYAHDEVKRFCCGCEACLQICPQEAISMHEDECGFRYPSIDFDKCVKCGLCKAVCPFSNKQQVHKNIESYGGYCKNTNIRSHSTSGGAFSAILEAAFEQYDYKLHVYGAVSHGIEVCHERADTLKECSKFRLAKYTQSAIGLTYKEIHDYLIQSHTVIFSGTPCQVAGLLSYLNNKDTNIDGLFTIEILCAGVATPIIFRKYCEWLKVRYNGNVQKFYWRYKSNNRWDYNCCRYELDNGKSRVIDRWFSGYWSLFTQRLLMRPSCEICRYKGNSRIGDITLGDLWGVHKEYPELYDGNRGTSWILVNTEKGKKLFDTAKSRMQFQEVEFARMEKYQVPSIFGKPFHPQYREFMTDLKILDYKSICHKWAKRPNIKLLFNKYIWNNNMHVICWKLTRRFGLFKQK